MNDSSKTFELVTAIRSVCLPPHMPLYLKSEEFERVKDDLIPDGEGWRFGRTIAVRRCDRDGFSYVATYSVRNYG